MEKNTVNTNWSVLFVVYLSVTVALSICVYFRVFFFTLVPLAILFLFFAFKILKPRENSAVRSFYHAAGVKNISFLCFAVVLVCSVFYWLAYYPGGFNLDAYGQWEQAHGVFPYNDWHPITSTLLIQLVTSFVDSFPFYIFVQIIIFSFSILYLVNSLVLAGINYKPLLLMAFYIGLSPAIGLNTICLTKDVQFTILLIFLTACQIRIIATNGSWFVKKINVCFFSLLSGIALLIRHNGILFVIPALIILLFFYRRQRAAILTAVLLSSLLVFCIKIPVSKTLNVEQHDNVVGETVGIPMAIMANALVSNPEAVPPDVYEFLINIAPEEEWNKYYCVGEWDSCKWEFGGTELLKDESLLKILSYTFKTILVCPQEAYASIRETTRIIWDCFKTPIFWIPEEYIAPNDFGITSAAVLPLHAAIELVKVFSLIPILSVVIWNSGFHIAVILITFIVNRKKVRTELLLLFIPLLFYDFGTTALLAGPNQRYFYFNAILFIPIILMLLREGVPE